MIDSALDFPPNTPIWLHNRNVMRHGTFLGVEDAERELVRVKVGFGAKAEVRIVAAIYVTRRDA